MSCIGIHLWLVLIDVGEVVIFLMIHLRKCLIQLKKDINVKAFHMIPGINESKASVKHISRRCEGRFEPKME